MKVSVITPSYNSVKTIEDTLRSVRDQAYPDIEHIVVDGGSKDGTLDIIREHDGHLAKWISEPDRGIYDAMNKGIAMATGDIIGILNSDDVYSGMDVISEIVNCFRDNPEKDAVYGDLDYVSRSRLTRVVRRWKTGEQKPFGKGWHPPHPTFFVRKEVYDNHGLFNLKFKLAADFELMLRLLEKHKIRTFYLEKVLIKMRRGGATNNSLMGIMKQNIECYKAFKENNLPVSLLYPIIRLVPKLKQFLRGL